MKESNQTGDLFSSRLRKVRLISSLFCLVVFGTLTFIPRESLFKSPLWLMAALLLIIQGICLHYELRKPRE